MDLVEMIRERMNRGTFGSLFSGGGGMDLGLEQAGFRCVWANEVDKVHYNVHKKNFPDTKMIEKSIHLLSTDELIDEFGLVDGIVGGFPCKHYSKAAALHNNRIIDDNGEFIADYGKYTSLEGDLFLHTRRVIGDIQPKFFVIENVTDVNKVSMVIRTLRNTPCSITGKRLGRYYTFHYGEVNTMDYGVAQRRKRMIIIGINREVPRPVLEKKKLTKRHIVGEILEEEPTFPLDRELPNYIRNRIAGGYRDRPSVKKVGRQVVGNTCIAHYANDQSTTMVELDDGTLRPYSVREYARLQGFPDEFFFPKKKTSYRVIGNAVSVPVAKAIGDAIAPLILNMVYINNYRKAKKGNLVKCPECGKVQRIYRKTAKCRVCKTEKSRCHHKRNRWTEEMETIRNCLLGY